MASRSDISGNDRFFGCLPYILTILEVTMPLSIIPFAPLQLLLAPFLPLLQLYRTFLQAFPLGIGSFALFLVLFIAVVQNPKVPYSVRFNTLQSILLGVLVSLWSMACELLLPLLGFGFVPSLVLLALVAAIPLAVFGVCLYSMVMTALGRYPDVPRLSENVYLMLNR